MGGVCGMGMCPLAMFLSADGCDVSGFDDSPNPLVEDMLRASGVGISRSRIPPAGCGEFIISSALKHSEEALRGGFSGTFSRRGEALAKIAASRRLIGICGSHGKTTTTSLIAHAVNSMGFGAGYMAGALPVGFPPARHCPEGAFFAAELDESDGTIENFSPEITVALNGDLDHTDTYPDASALEGMFERLFSRTKKYVVIPEGDEMLARASSKSRAQTVEVRVPPCDFIQYDKLMALAAVNLAFGPGFGTEIFDGFKGVARRQEVLCASPELFAIADYAHHPREVRSFLSWLDGVRPGRKLIFFQPHRYTRTKRFGADFRRLFEERAAAGDDVRILPVYAASEPFDPSGGAANIASPSVPLAQAGEMRTILEEFRRSTSGCACAAFIGAGDVYFEAKKIFSHEEV